MFVGRRVFGGTRQFLPLKVNQAGVMPVIFASSLLMFPTFIFTFLAGSTNWRWVQSMREAFERQGFIYNLFYISLIYFFCYFWTSVIFNPKDMANNLKDHGSFIPGYRPGKRTAEYLERVMLRITYVGAAFLAVVAIIPSLVSTSMGVGLSRRQFLRRYGIAYRRQRGPRLGSENRQPPGDAELSRSDGKLVFTKKRRTTGNE